MRATLPTAAVLAALAVAAPDRAAAFDATGEVVFRVSGGQASGAAFDAQQVVGAMVNMAIADDGTWSGDLAGQDVSLAASTGKLSGSNVNIVFASKDGGTSIEGLFFGRRVRIELDGKKLHGRYGTCSFDMKRKSPGVFSGDVGCLPRGATMPSTAKASLVFSGDAAQLPPQQPQFALGLLAVLPG